MQQASPKVKFEKSILKNNQTLDSDSLKLLRSETYIVPKAKFRFRGKITNPHKPIPKEIFQIKNLTQVDLSPNREAGLKAHIFDAFPIEITKLQNLNTLNLDMNELSSLPEEIGNLKQLETLTVTNNKLNYLPESIVNLKKLKSLHLSQNRFTVIPLAICFLKSLKFLDLSLNKISELPVQIKNLSATIETLIFLDNKLRYIPEALCECANLQTLWLASNKLEKLPKNFHLLKNLDWNSIPLYTSCLDGNPMEYPPMNVCKMGLKEILNYMSDPENQYRK